MPHDRLRNRVVTSANELTVPRWWSCGAIAISLTASLMPSRMSLPLADKRTCVPAAAMSGLCRFCCESRLRRMDARQPFDY
jgi:hypothetical protein